MGKVLQLSPRGLKESDTTEYRTSRSCKETRLHHFNQHIAEFFSIQWESDSLGKKKTICNVRWIIAHTGNKKSQRSELKIPSTRKSSPRCSRSTHKMNMQMGNLEYTIPHTSGRYTLRCILKDRFRSLYMLKIYKKLLMLKSKQKLIKRRANTVFTDCKTLTE